MTASVCFRLEAPCAERDRLIAELDSLGSQGLEEREIPGCAERCLLLVYFPDLDIPTRQVRALVRRTRGAGLVGPEPVPRIDWEQEWRRGLAPRRIGPLWIRPSWCASPGSPEICIDPEQAFGSGEHASTRLALQLLLEALRSGDTVLDLGTGTGILAIGALRTGAGAAVGLEIDADACGNAWANSRRNAVPLRLLRGTLDALADRARFDLAVANLLVSRLEPWIPRLARHARRAVILSGYLRGEAPRVEQRAVEAGLVSLRELEEFQSGDVWCASLWTHRRRLQSERTSSSVSSKR